MKKSSECEGCALFSCPGPVPSEVNGVAGWDLEGNVDVLFVSEAAGRHEIEQNRPMINPRGAGGILRQSLKQSDISSWGIMNTWRCQPPGNKLPEGEVPGKFCRDKFAEEIVKFNQKITVPLGRVGLNALTENKMSIMQVQGRIFTVNFNGNNLLLLSLLHPAFLLRQRSYWKDWEVGFEKLKRYLDGGELNYISWDDRKTYVAKTGSEALSFIRRLRSAQFNELAVDIETSAGYNPWAGAFILSISFAWSSTESCAIPWRLVIGETLKEMKLLLEDRSKTFVGYNLQFDVQFLKSEGIDMWIGRDAMLEAYLLDERGNVHSLKKDSGVYLNASDWEYDVKNYAPKKEDSYELIPEDKLLRYNSLDTLHTIHLSHVLSEKFDDGLKNVYDRIMIPATNMLSRARYVGLRIDVFKVKELTDTLVPVLNGLEHKLVEISEDAFFNPNSSQQKLALLRKRGLSVNDTRKETLQKFEGDEAVDAMFEYSEAHKMYSTYIVGIVDDVYDDLRVHPDFKLFGTETGRLSCKDPNLLGIPRQVEESEHKWKSKIKEIFVADKDTLLVHIDRKQSEIRCACYLSQDEVLAGIIKSGQDLHSDMARLMYGDDFTHEQRVLAKMVTFGLVYNREAPSLARQLGVTVREAQKVIDKFFTQMPRLLEWKKNIMRDALENDELTSWFGRKRRFGLVMWENKKGVENEAVNFPVSSLSSDLNLLSCVETMKQFGKYGVEVLVPIHDAGLLRIPKESSDDLAQEIKVMWEELIPKILDTDLPFSCDVTVGERWSDL